MLTNLRRWHGILQEEIFFPMANQSMPEGFKLIKLPRNGPKPGQSTGAWLAGKDLEQKRFQSALDGKAKKANG